MNEPKYGAFSSSVNPQELSLTITAGARVVIGLLASFGVIEATDADTLIEQGILLSTTVFTAWYSAQTMWGIVRKIIVRMSQR